ncbi:1 [Durusdinium trenchii]|uniref:1 n=1 Tax=Durusdinium trenchii TaxID=1381693 RepID=A0ABP0RNA0_9DINO
MPMPPAPRRAWLKPSEELENEEEPEAQEDSEDAAPPPRVAVLTSRSQAEAEPAEELEGCRCLRRGGLCTCREDARWLRSKRAQLTKYAPPHTRRAVLQPATPDAASSTCRCLRRHGCCSCQEDERWLQRKRRCVETYVPPHLKERQRELEQKRQEIAQKAEAPEAPEATPNIRTLARRWEPHLEGKSFGFNPLQLEGKIVCDDLGLEAECRESLLRSQGVKALPLVQWGNYHFEVELLRDCRLAVGWSSAMSHCTSWDMQAFGYTSEAQVVHQNELSDYGLAFGKAGDIVGSLVEWKAAGQVAVSFMLNGRDLGEAFQWTQAVPLQPQVTQLASGLPLMLRLRGTEHSGVAPLAFPKAGFRPLAEASSEDFCPFSRGVAEASTERTAALITEEHLEGFAVPDDHVVELYDLEGPRSNGATTLRLTQQLVEALSLPRPWSQHLCVREVSEGATALVALRRPGRRMRGVCAVFQCEFWLVESTGGGYIII